MTEYNFYKETLKNEFPKILDENILFWNLWNIPPLAQA